MVLFFFGMLLFSCGKKVIEPPENLIPKDKMVHILHDLAILNAIKSSNAIILTNNGVETMEFLYKKHAIDSTRFSESDLYYASIPLEYQSIYETVESMLEEKKKVMEEIMAKRNDSIWEVHELKKDLLEQSKTKK